MASSSRRMTAAQVVEYLRNIESDDSVDDEEACDIDVEPESSDESDDDTVIDTEEYNDEQQYAVASNSAEDGINIDQTTVESKDKHVWRIIDKADNVPSGRTEQHNVFKSKSGPSHVCRGIVTPEDPGQVIVDESMINYIRDCTVDYAGNVATDKKVLLPDWDVTIPKLKAFLGLMYLRGVLH